MRTNLQPFTFGFIVSLISIGGFTYLLHSCNGFELAVFAVGLVVAVVGGVACGLTIEKEVRNRIKAKKDND
jgi:uncharacterized membrane protein (DUF441 family)